MTTRWMLLAAVTVAMAGCNKEDSSAKAAKGPDVVVEVMKTPPPAPPPSANGKQADGPAAALNTGMESKGDASGLPTQVEGKALSTQQGLQRAADYYSRNLLPASVPQAPGDKRKTLPPLTDLQQLVDFRVIKAIPPAPDGKKWVLEGSQVKLK